MSFLFGGGEKAKVPSEPEIKAEEKRKVRGGASGSTILTSALGVLEEPILKRKKLLGE